MNAWKIEIFGNALWNRSNSNISNNMNEKESEKMATPLRLVKECNVLYEGETYMAWRY